jgi:peptidoglycan/xylan/chitin deacetylase (PgdA/CDA1 family)
MLIAVNYHYVRPVFDAPHPSIHGVTPRQFEAQLKLLGAAGEFVGAGQIRAALHGKPLPPRAIAITFDDGLREQADHAWPVLSRLGIPALFFINTAPRAEGKVMTVHKIHILRSQVAPASFLALLRRNAQILGIELERDGADGSAEMQYPYDPPEVARVKYLLNAQLAHDDRDRLIDACFSEVYPGQESAMSRDLYMETAQIRSLAERGCIGSHLHDHLSIGFLSEHAAQEQIHLSIVYLEKWTGLRPFAMSYPYGSRQICPPSVGALAAKDGIEFAFTMERAGNRKLDLPLHLARFDCNDVPGGKSCQWKAEEFFESVPTANWHR